MFLNIAIISIYILNIFFNTFVKTLKDSVMRNIFIATSVSIFLLTICSFLTLDKFSIILQLKNIPILQIQETKLGNIFLLLTTLVSIFVAIDIKTSIKEKTSLYINLLIATNIALRLCFLSKDILSFFVFFEFSIIPVFFMILLWGGKKKIIAAKQFLIYTIFGSSFILAAIIYLYAKTGSSLPLQIANSGAFAVIPENVKITLLCMMCIGFFVKIPTFPFHTWLPLAHVQAPTGGSMLLAGILIKLGGFGIIQYLLPIFTPQIHIIQNYAIIIGLISLIYGSFVAMGQTDVKKMIAYSSIAHMSYVVCGIFSLNENGINGAIFQMISHGIVSAGLFYMIGIVYSRSHTRDINAYGDLYTICPFYAKVFILLSMASVGLPGTIGFIGEIMTITSLSKISGIYTILLASGAILGATYMLHLCRKLLFGDKANFTNLELSSNEKINLYLLSALTIILGIYPKIILGLFA
ncbi:complex I subunit 4 family protein [Candidatus Deianiraea vastatrix]|uniref:NADH-quinone oxidoreductase subunit M n=1 Tax=Candidatus Deianiraea vastatrix TaxID=2163644 RepID=A0A5B8XCZ5_9RICK|nr:NADH-quinone oxidoreductase subunit M [Candidatus Deianiraea vastatrix]QED23249.1 NADH-quinone oxidoreductase subunit M [Candidatus Deianiraea vastatrix]